MRVFSSTWSQHQVKAELPEMATKARTRSKVDQSGSKLSEFAPTLVGIAPHWPTLTEIARHLLGSPLHWPTSGANSQHWPNHPHISQRRPKVADVAKIGRAREKV